MTLYEISDSYPITPDLAKITPDIAKALIGITSFIDWLGLVFRRTCIV